MGTRMTNSKSWKQECMEDYVRERMSPKEFAEHCGFTTANAHLILIGKSWKTTKRPEGFEYPWPERAYLHSRSWFERRLSLYREAFQKMEREGLNAAWFAEEIGRSIDRAYHIIKQVKQQTNMQTKVASK